MARDFHDKRFRHSRFLYIGIEGVPEIMED